MNKIKILRHKHDGACETSGAAGKCRGLVGFGTRYLTYVINVEISMVIFKGLNLFGTLAVHVISCLKDKVRTIDEISKSIGMNPLKFLEYLTILELEGKNLGGTRYLTYCDKR